MTTEFTALINLRPEIGCRFVTERGYTTPVSHPGRDYPDHADRLQMSSARPRPAPARPAAFSLPILNKLRIRPGAISRPW